MKIIECAQGSQEWFACRRGIPTASNFSRILTAKTMKLSAAADDYIYELIAERLTEPRPISEYASAHMQYGSLYEPAARAWYAMTQQVDVLEVGFCVSDCGRWGCSPDSLVGSEGCLELKVPAAKTHVEWLLNGGVPAEHLAQVHGQLIVTGRSFADWMSYCNGLPPLLVRVVPNEYTAALRIALGQFDAKFQSLLKKVQEMR